MVVWGVTNFSIVGILYSELVIHNLFREKVKNMNMFKEVFLSREGIRALIMIIVGILVAMLAGKFITNFKVADIVVILGSVLALVGSQQICQFVVMVRRAHENDDEQE